MVNPERRCRAAPLPLLVSLVAALDAPATMPPLTGSLKGSLHLPPPSCPQPGQLSPLGHPPKSGLVPLPWTATPPCTPAAGAPHARPLSACLTHIPLVSVGADMGRSVVAAAPPRAHWHSGSLLHRRLRAQQCPKAPVQMCPEETSARAGTARPCRNHS